MKAYYEGGGVTLYHADCRDVLPTLDASSVDLVLTDPPYGVAYSPAGGGKGWASKRFACHDLVYGDASPFDPSHLLRFQRLVLFGGNHFADKLPASPTWIVWDKRDGRVTNDFADCEIAWSNLGGPARLYHHLWYGAFRASERSVARVHPTQKPVALMAWIIERWTRPGELVLDPYFGSGSTLIAAQKCGRRAIGVEIEERYCEIAARRLSQAVLPLFDDAEATAHV